MGRFLDVGLEASLDGGVSEDGSGNSVDILVCSECI